MFGIEMTQVEWAGLQESREMMHSTAMLITYFQ